MAGPVPATPEPTTSGAPATRLRRHDSDIRQLYKEAMRPNQSLDWANACGYAPQSAQSAQSGWSQSGISTKKLLRTLQRNLHHEHSKISPNQSTPVIDISNMRPKYSLYRKSYRFLPRLSAKSNVALRRWHRQMQVFAGGFADLRRAQLYWDHHMTEQVSDEARELRQLQLSARRVLCLIEDTINMTSSERVGSSARRGISLISRHAMEQRLRFVTPLQHVQHAQRSRRPADDSAASAEDVAPHEVKATDLMFLKQRYFAYLRTMVKILRHKRIVDSRSGSEGRRRSGSSLSQSSSSSSSSGASTSSEGSKAPRRNRGRHAKHKSPAKKPKADNAK